MRLRVVPGEAIPGARRSVPEFGAVLAEAGCAELRRGPVTTLQVNVGKRCNQACHHCHVEAGPGRTEMMDRRTAERVIALLQANPDVEELDITGGAPELNDQFRFLVSSARSLGRRVLDRCNLTVLFEPRQEDTAQFLADNQVGIVASLPCYQKENVEKQRGRHVFERSLEALRWLNRLGYARPGSPLRLDLVYNPVGPFLPPAQAGLEALYREELGSLFGIRFNRLLTLTNMPIKRFAADLQRQRKTAEYQSLLVNHFNPGTVPGLMCRTLLSVGYDGSLYDCDFNQMLELPLGRQPRTIFDLERLSILEDERIATADHCFGCTAGAGSSCGGALAV
jgi:radical SAM/Cys-rich protein